MFDGYLSGRIISPFAAVFGAFAFFPTAFIALLIVAVGTLVAKVWAGSSKVCEAISLAGVVVDLVIRAAGIQVFDIS